MANKMSNLDAEQVIRTLAQPTSSGDLALTISSVAGNLVPKEYDQIELTYIGAGPGVGEVGTVVYKFNGAAVATLTLSYDGSNRLIDVQRS